MIQWLISHILSMIDPKQEGSHHRNKFWSFIQKMKGNKIVRSVMSWVIFLVVPFILFNYMDRMGAKETAEELQPQVAAIHELNTQEPLAPQLHVVWRTPKNYSLIRQFASDASREQILKYYNNELEKDGWKNDGMSEYHRHDTHVLMSQTYTWSKNGYVFEITFNLDNDGTAEKYTEDGKLKYYIDVVPESMKQ